MAGPAPLQAGVPEGSVEDDKDTQKEGQLKRIPSASKKKKKKKNKVQPHGNGNPLVRSLSTSDADEVSLDQAVAFVQKEKQQRDETVKREQSDTWTDDSAFTVLKPEQEVLLPNQIVDSVVGEMDEMKEHVKKGNWSSIVKKFQRTMMPSWLQSQIPEDEAVIIPAPPPAQEHTSSSSSSDQKREPSLHDGDDVDAETGEVKTKATESNVYKVPNEVRLNPGCRPPSTLENEEAVNAANEERISEEEDPIAIPSGGSEPEPATLAKSPGPNESTQNNSTLQEQETGTIPEPELEKTPTPEKSETLQEPSSPELPKRATILLVHKIPQESEQSVSPEPTAAPSVKSDPETDDEVSVKSKTPTSPETRTEIMQDGVEVIAPTDGQTAKSTPAELTMPVLATENDKDSKTDAAEQAAESISVVSPEIETPEPPTHHKRTNSMKKKRFFSKVFKDKTSKRNGEQPRIEVQVPTKDSHSEDATPTNQANDQPDQEVEKKNLVPPKPKASAQAAPTNQVSNKPEQEGVKKNPQPPKAKASEADTREPTSPKTRANATQQDDDDDEAEDQGVEVLLPSRRQRRKPMSPRSMNMTSSPTSPKTKPSASEPTTPRNRFFKSKEKSLAVPAEASTESNGPLSPKAGTAKQMTQKAESTESTKTPVSQQTGAATAPTSPRSTSNKVRSLPKSPRSPKAMQGLTQWREALDKNTGRFYYYNRSSGAVQWTKPEEYAKAEIEIDNKIKNEEASAQVNAAAPTDNTSPPSKATPTVSKSEENHMSKSPKPARKTNYASPVSPPTRRPKKKESRSSVTAPETKETSLSEDSLGLFFEGGGYWDDVDHSRVRK